MFRFAGLEFHLYGFLIGLVVVGAYQIAIKVGSLRGIAEKDLNRLSWWVISFGIIGARMYHVIDLWGEFYKQNLINIFFLWNGGLGIWGAIIGGLLGLILFRILQHSPLGGRVLQTGSKQIPLLNLLDVIVVGVPLGQTIGRLGNFFNQELYGKVSNLPWSIYITQTKQRHHPLFAYEAILNLILFIFLWKNRKIKKTGWLTGVYLCGYSIIRILLEPLRPEAIVWKIFGVPMASLMGVIMFFLGLILIFWQKRQFYKPHSYSQQSKV